MPISESQIERTIQIAKAYGVTKLILFGSAAESLQEARDIDIACDGVRGWKLFELSSALEEELNIHLDVVPLSPPSRFTKYIETKGRVIYDAG